MYMLDLDSVKETSCMQKIKLIGDINFIYDHLKNIKWTEEKEKGRN